MTGFCVECGAVPSGRNFCSDCGHPRQSMPVPPSDPTATALTTRRQARRRVPIAAAAVAVSVAALSGMAMNSQGQRTPGSDKPAPAQAAAPSGASASAAPTPEAPSTTAATPQTAEAAPPAPTAGAPGAVSDVPADGRWQGVLDDGAYTFDMTLSEHDGEVSGTVHEYDTADGDSGTQVVTGYRHGNTLHLRGTEYLHSSPGWKLDEFTVDVHPDGTMSGTFNCVGCRALLPLHGARA